MNYFLNYLLAVLLTSFSYFLGSFLIRHGIAAWQALVIGFSVVTLGALAEALGAPIWLIVLLPFPVGMFLLYLFLNESFLTWLLTYVTILALYTALHVFMSYFFHFHSLIPAWKLS